ncbi:MAG: NADH-quinone oxidoreductase subunit N [Archaeoglobaceae archaeon]
MLVLATSLVLLTIAAALSYWDRRVSLLISLAVAAASSTLAGSVAPLLLFVAVLNIVSFLVIRDNPIAGVDYTLVALILVATALAFASPSNDFATLLTAFVAASVPTYVLVMVGDRLNVDVAVKYVTFMVLATVLFLIGAALLYYSYENGSEQIYALALLALLVGLCIEVGVAPVHEWVPDVFASADPIPVSVVASLAKFAPFVVAYKIVLATATPYTATVMPVIAVIAAVSMFFGNVAALTSNDPSRILAYSTVANMGYILATFAALTAGKEYVFFAIAGGLLQLFVNSFGKIGFFNTIKGGSTSAAYAWLLSFSFIGLPPLMGFWSKLFIIYSLVNSAYLWLALVLVFNSAISVPYYVRLARLLGRGWKFSVANAVALFAALVMLVTIVPPTWFVDVVASMRW